MPEKSLWNVSSTPSFKSLIQYGPQYAIDGDKEVIKKANMFAVDSRLGVSLFVFVVGIFNLFCTS